MMELRTYQEEARSAIQSQWAGGIKRTLLVLPTGTGKTIVFSKIIEDEVRDGGRALVLAHRGELLTQAADKLAVSTGLGCAVEKAEESCLGSWYRVVVGSVQTLMRESRLAQFAPDFFDVIIVDEAHHVLADSYMRVLDHFDARVLGVTATPDRSDMRNLGSYFESLAYEYTLPRAIKEGYLSRISAQTIPLKLDLTGVSVQAGDFKPADLDTALDPYLHQIADEMLAAGCMERKTVVFLPLIKTSQKFRQILADKGFSAAEVNGKSDDRAEVLADFESGRYDVLCNSMLLTEGWDCPAVDCIVVLRPTKVRSLYCQMVGRGTRPLPGKDDLLLLDFLWHTDRHELCHPAHLIAESEDVAHSMTKSIEEAGGPIDIQVAEEQALTDVVSEREEALAKQLAEMKGRKRKLVDPLQFEMSIQAEDLANYVPAFGWEMAPPTEKQTATLEKLGILPDDIECAGKATKLLERLDKRRAEGLTTPKQIRFLEGKGFNHVGTWEFEAASKMIARISSNSWRTPRRGRPHDVRPADTRPCKIRRGELMSTTDPDYDVPCDMACDAYKVAIEPTAVDEEQARAQQKHGKRYITNLPDAIWDEPHETMCIALKVALHSARCICDGPNPTRIAVLVEEVCEVAECVFGGLTYDADPELLQVEAMANAWRRCDGCSGDECQNGCAADQPRDSHSDELEGMDQGYDLIGQPYPELYDEGVW